MTALRPPGALDEFRHEALETVISTNSECLARARAGDPGRLWITAARQTGGRGRRGRAWVSEAGNLYASLLLIDPAPGERLASLPLAAAIAAQAALRRALPHLEAPIEVKWPNDILIGRAKVCGILLEAERLPDGRNALVIGIGVNIRHCPGEVPYPVTRLADHGAAISADELFAHLFREMADVLQIWNEGRGAPAISRAWRQVACGIGERIVVNLPAGSLSGIFSAIDDSGFLLLDTGEASPLSIAAGDVFFEKAN